MTTEDFFDQQTQESRIKATIVTKYFLAWSKIMIAVQKKWKRGDRIGYIDLFCGPGRYRDGGKSTPLLILEAAIADPELRDRLVTIFNDQDAGRAEALRQEIAQLPGVTTLKYPPESRIGRSMMRLREASEISA